jgi:hypothetical protein
MGRAVLLKRAINGKFFYDIEISKGTLRKSFNAGKKFNIGQDNFQVGGSVPYS